MISNCGHDENNSYAGGRAGDQTGGEWTVRSWYRYSRGWDMILRYPDRAVGNLLAELSMQAANNNHVGYDQNQRYTYWQKLQNAGYYPSKIKSDCEADCSSGVLANVKAVGYLLKIKALQNINQDGWTGSMASQLTAIGFKALTASKYLTSDEYLLPGDILLNELYHTAVNLDAGANAGDTAAAKPAGSSEKNVMYGQLWLNEYYGSFLKSTFGELLEVDGVYGKKTRRAAMSVWKDVCNRLFGTTLSVKSETFGSKSKSAASKYALVEFGSSGTHTLILQLLLSAKGYYRGKMNVECGRELCVSIQTYEKDKGLTVDSQYPERCVAGKQVWSSLFE